MTTHRKHDQSSRPITITVRSLLIAAALSLSLLVTHAPPALAYSCGEPTPDPTGQQHCYATVRRDAPITRTDGWLGASVAISVTDMTCSGCDANFIDNEMWLRGPDSSNNGRYWVEAGYERIGNSGQVYFWADWRPNSLFYGHQMGTVPAGDYYHNATFWIYRTPGWADRFSVQMISWTRSWTGLSTDNWMQVLRTDMGMELSGYSGAHAGTAFFTSRYYQALNTYWYLLPAWRYGDPERQDAPTQIFQNGSDFYTYCTC